MYCDYHVIKHPYFMTKIHVIKNLASNSVRGLLWLNMVNLDSLTKGHAWKGNGDKTDEIFRGKKR